MVQCWIYFLLSHVTLSLCLLEPWQMVDSYSIPISHDVAADKYLKDQVLFDPTTQTLPPVSNPSSRSDWGRVTLEDPIEESVRLTLNGMMRTDEEYAREWFNFYDLEPEQKTRLSAMLSRRYLEDDLELLYLDEPLAHYIRNHPEARMMAQMMGVHTQASDVQFLTKFLMEHLINHARTMDWYDHLMWLSMLTKLSKTSLGGCRTVFFHYSNQLLVAYHVDSVCRIWLDVLYHAMMTPWLSAPQSRTWADPTATLTSLVHDMNAAEDFNVFIRLDEELDLTSVWTESSFKPRFSSRYEEKPFTLLTEELEWYLWRHPAAGAIVQKLGTTFQPTPIPGLTHLALTYLLEKNPSASDYIMWLNLLTRLSQYHSVEFDPCFQQAAHALQRIQHNVAVNSWVVALKDVTVQRSREWKREKQSIDRMNGFFPFAQEYLLPHRRLSDMSRDFGWFKHNVDFDHKLTAFVERLGSSRPAERGTTRNFIGGLMHMVQSSTENSIPSKTASLVLLRHIAIKDLGFEGQTARHYINDSSFDENLATLAMNALITLGRSTSLLTDHKMLLDYLLGQASKDGSLAGL